MSLKEKLQSDLHTAMRSRDRTRVSVLRMLRSAIGYEEIDKKREMDDSAVLDIISRQVRQRRESIQMYKDANRQELVDKETQELEILQEYMPAQLTEEELTSLAQDVIQQVGATGPGDKGRVMGRLMPQVRGKAQGGDVNPHRNRPPLHPCRCLTPRPPIPPRLLSLPPRCEEFPHILFLRRQEPTLNLRATYPQTFVHQFPTPAKAGAHSSSST